MAMDDLLKAILGGAMAPQQGGRQQAAADPMADLIGSILGGGAAPQRQPAPQSGSLDNLLEDFMGGSANKVPAPAPSGGLEDILGSILGGGAAPQRQPASPSGGGLGDILGAILGGGAASQGQPAAPSGGGLGGILGSILGSGTGGDMSQNAFLAPITDALAEKTGLPPAIAGMVVSFLIGKLFSGKSQGVAAAPAPRPSGSQTAPSGGMDLDHLLEQMGGGGALQPSYFGKSGLAQELASQTGLDTHTAEKSLEEAFSILGGQLQQERKPRPSNQTPSGGLEHLLDAWD